MSAVGCTQNTAALIAEHWSDIKTRKMANTPLAWREKEREYVSAFHISARSRPQPRHSARPEPTPNTGQITLRSILNTKYSRYRYSRHFFPHLSESARKPSHAHVYMLGQPDEQHHRTTQNQTQTPNKDPAASSRESHEAKAHARERLTSTGANGHRGRSKSKILVCRTTRRACACGESRRGHRAQRPGHSHKSRTGRQ